MNAPHAGHHSTAIGSILTEVLQQTQQRHATLSAIQQDWVGLVGKRLARHTKPVSLRQGRLVIQTDHAGDGFLLRYAQPQLREQLAQRTHGAVTEVIVRPADAPSSR